MIRVISIYDADGRYLESGTEGAGFPAAGALFYVGPVNMDLQYHDLVTNVPADMPTKPSQAHQFDYITKTWVPDTTLAWLQVRSQRDQLLKNTDWLVTKAVETGEPMPAGWAGYRQALRDVTNQADPLAIVWPVVHV